MTGHPATRLVGASLVAQVALVVSGPLVVRMLGISDRGRLALVFAVVLLVSQVGVAGVPAAVAWFVSSRSLDAAAVIATVQRRFVGQALGCSVIAGIVVLVLDLPGSWLLALIVVVGVAGVMAAILGLAALQGQQRFSALAWLQPLPAVSYAVATAVLLVTGGGSVAVLLAINLAGWVIVAFVSLRLVGAGAPQADPEVRPGKADVSHVTPSPDDVRRYARNALVATAAPIDTLGIEQLLVGLLLGHYVLGLFTIGWAFETGPVVVLVALASFVGPRVGALAAAERPAFVRRWLLVAAGLGVAACLAIQLILAPALIFAFGADAEPAIPLARVLVAAGVLLGLRRVGSACLVGMGEARAATWCELVGFATLLVGMLYAALPGTALSTVCWALVLAGAVSCVAQLLVLARAGSSGADVSA